MQTNMIRSCSCQAYWAGLGRASTGSRAGIKLVPAIKAAITMDFTETKSVCGLFGNLHRNLRPLPQPLRLVADGGDVFHDQFDMAGFAGFFEEAPHVVPRPLGMPRVASQDGRIGFSAEDVVGADFFDPPLDPQS